MKENKSINVKLKFSLTQDERGIITRILRKGKDSVRVFKRARILELFDSGQTSPKIAKAVGVTPETVRRIGWNYIKGGLNQALYDSPRPGAEKKLTKKQEAHIIAIVCSDPPNGYSRWSIRLLTEKIIEKKIADSIGRETIRVLLKSQGIKPWLEKNVVRSGIK